MSKFLLDSSALVDWLKGRPAAVSLLERLIETGDTLAVNAITVCEVYSGLADDETGPIEQVLQVVEYWPIGIDVAKLAGQYRYAFARRGRALATPDMLIAAQAVLEGAALVTGNVRDFPMPELEILPLPAE